MSSGAGHAGEPDSCELPSDLSIPDQIRSGIREALLDEENLKPGGPWWHQIQRVMPPAMRHQHRKKFLNQEEAMEWIREHGWRGRAYPCKRCPFFHISQAGMW